MCVCVFSRLSEGFSYFYYLFVYFFLFFFSFYSPPLPSGVNVECAPLPLANVKGRSSIGGQSIKVGSRGSGVGGMFSSNTRASTSRCFAFQLSNHTCSQYGVCLVLPRTFRDLSRGLSISTEYCVCVTTRFPFLSYFFHMLRQFEAMGGFDLGGGLVDEPLRAQDDSFPIQAELRLLNDLASRLSKVQLPIYANINDALVADNDLILLQQSVDQEIRKDDNKGGLFYFMPSILSMMVRYQRRVELVLQRDQMHRYFNSCSVGMDGGLGREKLYRTRSFGVDFGVSSSREDDASYTGRPCLDDLEAERDKEICFHTLIWALPILLRFFPLVQIVLAIGCALSEMNIVVRSPDSSTLSGCILALQHLLRPLKWAGNTVITLPHFLPELLGTCFAL